ncbi:MAG: creatininase family protein [Persephonella sp.]|nr:MAG: creatininase family protein [Persephonella sp.]
MLLENLTFEEVENYLKEKDIILIPIGSTEQHSSYGLIGTDFITAQEITKEVGKRLNILVAPTLPYGMSQHHMAFAGTITVSPLVYTQLIRDIILSLLSHGFKKIIFINGHGGNINSVRTAFEQVKYEGKNGFLEIISWFLLPEVQELERELFKDENGYHATPSEVSLTQYLRSKVFSDKKKEKDRDNINVNMDGEYFPLTKEEFRAFYPDGRIHSSPWLARVEFGRKIFEKAVESIIKRIQAYEKIEIK